jgi:hypothetical protein
MRLAPVLAIVFCLVPPAFAATPMSPDEFEAWSTGKTLDYFVDGSLWGSEMHLADRSTLDADVGGDCRSGHWYPQGDTICFVYELSPGPYCWRFLKDGGQVFAEFAGDPLPSRISVSLSDAPLSCDPGVGV